MEGLPSSTLSPVAQSGFSASDTYDAHRPSYNASAVQQLLEQTGVAGRDGADIIEIAAGTGKFTQLLAARPEGYRVVATEPHKNMRKTLEGKTLSGVEVRAGAADSVPVQSASADAVFVAQAFHWFANTDALNEFARILRPGGALGIIWNCEDYNNSLDFPAATSWEAALRDAHIKRTKDATPRYRDAKWQKVFEEDPKKVPFITPIGEKLFREQKWIQKQALWARLNTMSNVANLDPEDLKNLRSEFDRILADVEVNSAGEVVIHSTCHIFWTRKK